MPGTAGRSLIIASVLATCAMPVHAQLLKLTPQPVSAFLADCDAGKSCNVVIAEVSELQPPSSCPPTSASVFGTNLPDDAKKKIVDYLRAHRGDPKEVIYDGFLRALKALCPCDAKTIADVQGRNALADAIEAGDITAARRAISGGASLTEMGQGGTSLSMTPLIRAVSKNKPDMVKLLLDSGLSLKDQGDLALYDATEDGFTEVMKVLIAAGVDAGKVTNGEPLLYLAAERKQPEAIKLLASLHADVNAKGPLGKSALHESVSLMLPESVQALVALGADVNRADPGGETPLMSAASYGYANLMKPLLDAHADGNAKAANGTTALMRAAANGHLEAVQMLISAHADVNAKANDGTTVLWTAMTNSHYDVALALLTAHADGKAAPAGGTPYIVMAAAAGNTDLTRAFIQAGVDVNARKPDDKGTALIYAAIAGKADVVKLLLDAKADANLVAANGQTAFDIAKTTGKADILALLTQKGAKSGTPDFVPDGKAQVTDLSVVAQLRPIAAAKTFDEAAARKLTPYALYGFDLPKRDLIYELIAAKGPVTVTTPMETLTIPPPDAAARAYLTLVKTFYEAPNPQVLLDQLWLRGPAQMKQVADASTIGGEVSPLVHDYAVKALYAAWQQSNVSNGYQPFRDAVNGAFMQIKQNDPASATEGFKALYGWSHDLDVAIGDGIPDFLYNWVQTAKP